MLLLVAQAVLGASALVGSGFLRGFGLVRVLARARFPGVVPQRPRAEHSPPKLF